VTDGAFAYWSPDGRTIVTQDDVGVTDLWDASTGVKIASLGDNLGAAYAPDGRQIAVTGCCFPPARAAVYDAHDGRRLYSLVPPDGTGTWGTTFSPDGNLLATADDDHRARIHDASTGKILQTFWGPTGNEVVTFSPDGKQIATTADGNTARIWSVATGAPLHTFTANPDDGFASITFSPDGTLFAGGMLHGAEIWDARNGRVITSLPVESRFSRASFSRDGKLLAVTGTRGVRVYSARTWRLIRAFPVDARNGVSARFSPDSKLLATGSTDGYARIWDIATGRVLIKMQAGTIGPNGISVYSVDFSPNGKRLVTSSAETMVWSLANGRRLRILHH
jgi:WD40 repeat protein